MSISAICKARLEQERTRWRKDRPFGFKLAPSKNPDGSANLLVWDGGIPGKQGTLWEGGLFSVRLTFPAEYPLRPPKVAFVPPLFHPNVYPSGTVCLSIIDESADWKPAISLKQILLGIQELLNDPNPNSPAQGDALRLFQNDRPAYDRKIRQIARANTPK